MGCSGFISSQWLFLTDVLSIQVTDARATMALYRLHKTEWEQAMWKETQAFLAKQKKGSNSGGDATPIGGGKKGHGPGQEEVEGNGKKRKSAAPDGMASKRPKKAASNGQVVQGEGSRDDGNWWES